MSQDDRRKAGLERQGKVARDIQRRLVDHIRNGGTDLEAGPMRHDAAVYTSQDWFDREQEYVFTRLPLLVGMSRDLPEPGSKLLFEEVGPSILVVRTQQGTLKAYLNMCTHRAARLVSECTTAKRMTCGFHGWTFDLDGELVGQPGGKRGFAGIDRDQFRLVEVPVEEWHGLIFVIARPGTSADINVEAYLGSFAPELAQMGFERANPVRKTRLDVAANWKYAYDTYGEGYHFATLHPTSIARTAHSDMVVHDKFGLHARINFPYRDQDAYVDKPEEEWVPRPYGGVHLLFPNTVINVSSMGPGQVFSIYRIFPDGGPDKAFSLMAAYRSGEVADDVDMKPWEEFHDFIMNVVSTEDYSISASGHRNLRFAPAGFKVTYGANEGVLQDFHRNLAAIVGQGG